MCSRRYINEWVWMCFRKTLVTKQATDPQILVCRPLDIWTGPELGESILEGQTIGCTGVRWKDAGVMAMGR